MKWVSRAYAGLYCRLLVSLAGVCLLTAAGPARAAPSDSLVLVPAGRSAMQSHLEAALRKAQLSGAPVAVAAAHHALGEFQQQTRHFGLALRHYQLALGVYDKLPSPAGSAALLGRIGRVHYLQGDTAHAHLTFVRALDISLRLHDQAGTARLYDQLGQLFDAEQKWPRAQASYEQALTRWQQLSRPTETARTLMAIGLAHKQQRHYSRALYYLQQAYWQGRQGQDSTRVGETLEGIAGVYQAVGNQELAAGFYTQALGSLPKASQPQVRLRLLQALAAAKVLLGNDATAEAVLRQAIVLARQTGSKPVLRDLYHTLADLYRRDGSYSRSLGALTRYAGLQDTVFAEERAAQVAELRARFETEKKEREIQLLTKDRQIQQANLRRQTLLRNVLGVGFLLLLGLAAVLYRSRRQQARINRLLQRKNAAINRQKEELGQLNRTKDTLFSVISHDLRSPLSSLYSLLSLLNMGTLPPERLAAHSARLSRTLDSTLRLLDNLLNWSAVQMQGSVVRPEPVRLDLLVEETLTLLLGDAERKSILLLNQVAAPSIAQADLNMTRLVIRNLLGNAIKFTPENGSITVSAMRQGKWWEVAVADTGVGIAAADHEKIFGTSGPHSTLGTARERGTGLGLQLCRSFVERNGGRIYLESAPGMGTTFRFTLPVAKAEPAQRPAERQTSVAAAESASG